MALEYLMPAAHKLDWNEYRKELAGRLGEFAELSPGTMEGYQALAAAGRKTAHLDAKTRELIALAVGVTTRCDGCIAVHWMRWASKP